jgi:hypothetical protein
LNKYLHNKNPFINYHKFNSSPFNDDIKHLHDNNIPITRANNNLIKYRLDAASPEHRREKGEVAQAEEQPVRPDEHILVERVHLEKSLADFKFQREHSSERKFGGFKTNIWAFGWMKGERAAVSSCRGLNYRAQFWILMQLTR